MRALNCLFALGAVTAFALAAWLEPWFQGWSGNRAKSANLLHVALGDGRKLFARHFYVKADAYFHRGFYPSIFDNRSEAPSIHLATVASGDPDHADEGPEWLGRPKDWLERFSRHFVPSRHLHLGDAPSTHPHDDHDQDHHADHEDSAQGEERELLPWLRLSASLDPEQPQTYLVTAYWLRTRLGKVNEAEQFLREGLRHVPHDPEMLFELGRIQSQHRSDPERARTLWELALRRWREQSARQSHPDKLIGAQLLSHLAKLEEDAGNYPRALEHLQALDAVSPHHEAVQKWLEDVRRKADGR